MRWAGCPVLGLGVHAVHIANDDSPVQHIQNCLLGFNRQTLDRLQCFGCFAASDAFPGIPLDAEGVFSCDFTSKLNGELWIAMGQDGRVRGAIGSETRNMEHFSYKDTEISVLLTRLFYLLFDARPSANKLIDAFLSHEPSQAPDTPE